MFFGGRSGDCERHLPQAVAAFVGRGEAKLFLGQVQRDGVVVLGGDGHVDDGESHLFGPSRHDLLDRFAAGVLETPPQVFGLRVGVGVLFEVSLHALLELFRSDPTVNHPDDVAALLVRDGVEDLVHFGRVVHRNLDGVAVLQAVELERANGVVVDVLLPNFEIRVAHVRRVVLHEGGEALVEPQVRPPLHGDEVAEPLVRHLVAHHDRHPLLLRLRRLLLVDQQRRLPVRDQPPVLHGRAREVGDGDQVQLVHRVRAVEEVGEVLHRFDGHFQRVLSLVGLSRRRVHFDVDAVVGLALNVVELSHYEGQQVGGHLLRLGVHHLLGHSVLENLLADDVHVGEGDEVLRHVQSHVEGGFQGGLVPAGEALPGVGGLELGDQVVPLLPVLVGDLGAVEPGHLVVVDPLEAHVEDGGSLGYDVIEHEGAGFFLLVQVHLGWREVCS